MLMSARFRFSNELGSFTIVRRKRKVSVHPSAGLRRDVHLRRPAVRDKRVHFAVGRVRSEHGVQGEGVVERQPSHR